MARKIKTALIGLGHAAADIHLPACQMTPQIELVAGCDPDVARRQQRQAQFGIPAVFADVDQCLAATEPALAIVGTPPLTHQDVVTAALNAGAHVLCEKPFMPNLAAADTVIALAQQQQRLLAVNNQYRYMSIYRDVKKRLQAGDYGRLFFVHCWQQMFHPPATDKTAWRTQLPQYTLFEFGTHPIDLLCYLFDALPEAVHAVTPRVRSDYNSDVLVQATLYFPQDRLATLLFNRVSHAPERYFEMRLDCEEASIRISLGGVARASATMSRYRGQTRPSLRFSFVRGGEARAEVGGRSQVIAQERTFAFASATARHLQALLPELQAPVTSWARATHARDVLRVVAACYEAAATRQIVTLPQTSNSFLAQTANG